MKKIKKIIATSLLVSLIFTTGNVVAFKKMDVCNSTGGDFSGDYYDGKCTKDGKPTDDKIQTNNSNTNTGIIQENPEDKFIHKLKKVEFNLILNRNPLLMSFEEKTRNKDIQLCSIADHFDILDEEGNVRYTYYPQGCKKDNNISNNIQDNTNEVNDNEKLIDDLFNIQDNTNEVNDNEKLIDDLFNIQDNINEVNNNELSNENSTESQSNNEKIDVDNILEELFQSNIKTQNNISLKGKKFAKTIKDFSKQKVSIRVGKTKANVLSDNIDYSLKVANLLGKVDKEFKIDSIKNDFSKNISDLSFSYYTYKNTKDLETKNVFKNQLIKDIIKLKKKYKILKFKDKVISQTLEKRGEI